MKMLLLAIIFIFVPALNINAGTVLSGLPSPPQDTQFTQIQETLSKLHITESQYYILELSRRIGDKYDLGDSLMAIAWQESRAGEDGPIGDIRDGFGYRSYGICQIKLKTARAVLRKYPELGDFPTNEQLLVALITDPRFNLEIAVHRLLMLRNKGLSWSQMIATYNIGHPIRYPAKWSYTKDIRQHLQSGPVSELLKQGSF